VSDLEKMDALAGELADLAQQHDLTVAAAESLTSGAVASALGRAPRASVWFAGGVVAYSTRVKQRVLGVATDQVVTEEAAVELARGVASLLEADLAVSVTGVGGPDSEEGHPAGTAWLGVASRRGAFAELHHFDGDPSAVVQETTLAALRLALTEARRLAPSDSGQVS
jgi:nicotinamide-nucleotide amidase